MSLVEGQVGLLAAARSLELHWIGRKCGTRGGCRAGLFYGVKCGADRHSVSKVSLLSHRWTVGLIAGMILRDWLHSVSKKLCIFVSVITSSNFQEF